MGPRKYIRGTMDQLRAVDALGAGWLAGVLLLALGVLAWVNMVAPKQWTVLARSFGAFRLGRHRLREDLDLRDRTLTGLLALSTVLIALYLYQLLVLHGWVPHGPLEFGRLLLGVAAVTVFQLVLLRALAVLPATDGGLEEYLYTVVVFQVVFGLLLLPVVTVLAYPPQVEWRAWAARLGLVLACGVVLFRWVRAAVIGVGKGVPLRYIFIYLCALEILPTALALQYAWHFVPPSQNP